jgi:hypothetical protein
MARVKFGNGEPVELIGFINVKTLIGMITVGGESGLEARTAADAAY